MSTKGKRISKVRDEYEYNGVKVFRDRMVDGSFVYYVESEIQVEESREYLISVFSLQSNSKHIAVVESSDIAASLNKVLL